MLRSDYLLVSMLVNVGTSAFYGAVEKLSEAIEKAEAFPHLLADIESAQALREQWVNRAKAVERLESVMMQARQPIKKGKKPGKGGKELQGFDIGVLESSIKLLEGAIEEAKESNIGVDKARRLLKEIQAQAAAVEAANHLDSIMAKKPCGSGVLRVRAIFYCFWQGILCSSPLRILKT